MFESRWNDFCLQGINTFAMTLKQLNMKFPGIFTLLLMSSIFANAQTAQGLNTADTTQYGTVSVQKDRRIDILGDKMYEYNVALSKKARIGKGYRLMLLSTNDRNLAMNTRTRLLQQFPEHKVYMAFQSPFIKLKMGNFEEKAEAEKLRKFLISQKIVPGNIYILPENIEIKAQEENEEE